MTELPWIKSYPKGVRYNSRELDPVWEAVVESGIPLSFHVTAIRAGLGGRRFSLAG